MKMYLVKSICCDAQTDWHLNKTMYVCRECKQSCETYLFREDDCEHTKTVAINEEGHAGVYCAGCGERLKEEC